MKKYRVCVELKNVYLYEIEAESEHDARDIACAKAEGEFENSPFEYDTYAQADEMKEEESIYDSRFTNKI